MSNIEKIKQLSTSLACIFVCERTLRRKTSSAPSASTSVRSLKPTRELLFTCLLWSTILKRSVARSLSLCRLSDDGSSQPDGEPIHMVVHVQVHKAANGNPGREPIRRWRTNWNSERRMEHGYEETDQPKWFVHVHPYSWFKYCPLKDKRPSQQQSFFVDSYLVSRFLRRTDS